MTTPPAIQAAFADEGAAWSDGRQACVARWPELRPVCPPWPVPTGAVAWNGGQAWTALPSIGQAVTLDGPALSITAGRVTAMSSTRLYREDGSALSYSGAPVAGTVGRPSAVVTGGDGLDYALVAGRLYPVDRSALSSSIASAPSTPLGVNLGAQRGAHLQVTRDGAIGVMFPSADVPTFGGTLELRGSEVYRQGSDIPLSLPGPAAALGLIRGEAYVLLRPSDGGWQLFRLRSMSPASTPA